jgi:hypothetical protein
MTQTVTRRLFVLVAAVLVAAVATSAALAAPGHGRFGNRMAARTGGFVGFAGPQFGGFLGGPGGFGVGGPGIRGGRGFFAFGPGGPGMGAGGPGGAGVLAADVLTPAASFLGIPVSTLTADLKGGKTLAQEATAKGKTADDLIAAIVTAQTKVFDAENAAGWITDAQETSLLAEFKADVTQLVNVGPPVPPTPRPGLLQTASDYIGISVSDIQTALQSGKSLGQIATDNGKTVDGLVTALTAQAKTNLDAAVTAGKITAAQEQTILSGLTARVTDLVNNVKSTTSAKMTSLTALFRR